MLNRTNRGNLRINDLSLKIFLGDLFQQCKNESEIDFLKDTIIDCTELIAEETLEEL